MVSFSCALRTYIGHGRLSYEVDLLIFYRARIRTNNRLHASYVKMKGEKLSRLFTANDCLEIGIEFGSLELLDYYENASVAFVMKYENEHVRYFM